MTTLDPGRIALASWVIHEIPRSSVGNVPAVTWTQSTSPYDQQVARFFERKVTESLAKSSHKVLAQADAEIPAEILASLSDPAAALLPLSVTLGARLLQAQTGAMSGGLLVTLHGDHAGDAVVAVLKLEKEEGARAAAENNVEGKTTYTVEYLTDLFLTGRTRVFKVAVFLTAGPDEPLEGWLSDPQGRGADVADFFLDTFLGCKLEQEPALTTQQFHTEAEVFINATVTNPERKARYTNAVMAELTRTTANVSLADFARDHLDDDDRAAFTRQLRAAGIPATFRKDNRLIKGRLRRLQYDFDGGVKITTPADLPDGVVNLEGLADGRTRIQVTDVLKEVGSRG